MLARNQPEPRKIDLQPGHRQDFWHRTCVAIGVSAGFVEPRHRSAMSVLAKRFNEVTRQRWQAIVDSGKPQGCTDSFTEPGAVDTWVAFSARIVFFDASANAEMLNASLPTNCDLLYQIGL